MKQIAHEPYQEPSKRWLSRMYLSAEATADSISADLWFGKWL